MTTLILFIALILLTNNALTEDTKRPPTPNPYRNDRFKAGLPPEIEE